MGDATLEEFSQSMAARPLEFTPGTDYRYGYSIDILGRYIEAIEGKSLDQVMRERVFAKLGMNDTDFWVKNPKDEKRIAIVYRKDSSEELTPAMLPKAVLSRPARMMGGQGLISTTRDYAKFCKALLNNGKLNQTRILKEETVQLMFKNHLENIDKTYGLGGRADSSGRYSWGGAAGTGFWIDQNTDTYTVFMIQRWGYEVDTFTVFRNIVSNALSESQESLSDSDSGRNLPPTR